MSGPKEKRSLPLLASRKQYGNGGKPALNYSNLCVFITEEKGWVRVGEGVETNKQINKQQKNIFYSEKALDFGFSSVLASTCCVTLSKDIPLCVSASSSD